MGISRCHFSRIFLSKSLVVKGTRDSRMRFSASLWRVSLGGMISPERALGVREMRQVAGRFSVPASSGWLDWPETVLYPVGALFFGCLLTDASERLAHFFFWRDFF